MSHPSIPRNATPLLNRARAEAIMDKYGLDGLVAAIPLNIYYLSSHRGPMQWMGRPFSTYAVLPRASDAPASLVVHGSVLYHLFGYRPTWMPLIETYSGPRLPADSTRDERFDDTADPRVSIWAGRLRRDGMRQADEDLLAIYSEYEGKTHRSALTALRAAIEKGGLRRGTIGFDDPRVLSWLQEAGLPALRGRDAQNIFREIRMVKSPAEIELLSEAARKNEDALLFAINRIDPGTSLDAIERAHAQRWAELGGCARWCITNIRGLAHGTVSRGDFMKLDSVGEYQGYLGDVGRTVCCGEPSDELVRRIEATTLCLRHTYREIRPGVTFARARSVFEGCMKEHGFDALGAPHAVGLEHTDQPWPTGVERPGEIEALLTFQEGMVFTFDAPYHEIGWGTTHVEDMMVVTQDGTRPLSSMDTSLIVRHA